MRSLDLRIGCLILAGLGAPASAAADPMAECRALTADQVTLEACLDRRLDESYAAMVDALGGARAAARDVDRQTGRETATLGVEASQQAWEAYRDTACKTWAAFVDRDAAAGTVELACAIAQTDRRTAMLLELATLQNR